MTAETVVDPAFVQFVIFPPWTFVDGKEDEFALNPFLKKASHPHNTISAPNPGRNLLKTNNP
jgi:hypothetical protein